MALLTVAVGGSLTAFCLCNSAGVITLFLKEPEALALGQRMIRLLVLSGPFLGFFYMGSSFLQASGNAVSATFVSALRQGILLIPLLFVMNTLFGVTGNIWAHVIADISSAAVSVSLALRQYRRLCRARSPAGRP